MQSFDAWGKRLSGTVRQTDRNYTGQYLDDTGLLFYNARYYDPQLGRFISADSIVPGNASGGMAGVAYKPLTVDFHEPGFAARVAQENQFGPWYTLSDQEQRQLGNPFGPATPQALNRYAYVLNNPLKWTDPGGHFGVSVSGLFTIRFHLTNEEAYSIYNLLGMLAPTFLTSLGSVLAGLTAPKAIAWVESQLIPLGFGGALLSGVITTLIRMGVDASNIVALVTLLGTGLAIAAHAYGDQGVDIYISPLGGWLLPPTVNRQHSLWVDLSSDVSYKICDCELPVLTEKLVQYIRHIQE